jgi:hypothetical protein
MKRAEWRTKDALFPALRRLGDWPCGLETIECSHANPRGILGKTYEGYISQMGEIEPKLPTAISGA